MPNLKCEECKKTIEEDLISVHLDKEHPGISLRKYKLKYPGAPEMSQESQELRDGKVKGIVRRAAVLSNDILVMGIPFERHSDVLLEACLSAPAHYREPRLGKLTQALREAALLLKAEQNAWIHGPPGSGKDAFLQDFSERTRTPALFLQVNQDTNLQSWFFRRGFNAMGKTVNEDGKLLKACRDGYRTKDGKKVPYLIVLSDFDRADPRKMENFRSLLESNGRRIPGAQGKFYNVLEGTRFAFTANSSGGGDEHGRCITSNVIDSSFLDRVLAIKVYPMEWADEIEILKESNPDFFKWATPIVMGKLKTNIDAIRDLIAAEELNIEFTTRTVMAWIKQVEMIRKFDNRGDVMLRGARVAFIDKAGDHATQETILTAMNIDLDTYGDLVVEGRKT